MRNKTIFIILNVVLFLIIIVSITLGSVKIGILDSFKIVLSKVPILGEYINIEDVPNSHRVIINNLRLPRIIMAGLVGMGLSVCGAMYQSILKNSMADPYILGVSSGAALGATISIVLNRVVNIQLMAFMFSIIVTVLVYTVSRYGSKKDNTSLILTGININYFLTAIISLIMILNRDQLDKIFFWTMGSFATSTWKNVLLLGIVIIPIVIVVSFLSKYFNAISLDEKTAKSVGINTEKFKKIIVVLTCIITALCVSTCGIIGFVGLMVPHMIRLIFGGNYKLVIPMSGILGAIFTILSDDLARTVIAPTEIPIGIITSIVGAPYLLYLICRKRKGSSLI